MEMRKVRRVIVGLIYFGFVFVLSGCGTISTYPTDVRNTPDDVRAKLSIGDTRQKVRSILGDPLIDARSHGVEAYLRTGRDLDIALAGILPLPVPGKKVTLGALVVYDDQEKIKYREVDVMTDNLSEADEKGYQFCSLRISAGGYHFFNNDVACAKPETLIGPPISLDELSNETGQAGVCSVVFLMGECPMEIISIDDSQVADLSPAGFECRLRDPNLYWARMQEKLPPETYDRIALMHDQRKPKFNWTFIKMNISPGTHHLLVRQTTHVKERDFDNVFDCVSGDTVYVELDANKVRHSHWWSPWLELEGGLVVSKTPSRKQIERAEGLSPILWHKGRWYGPPQGRLPE